MFVGQADEAYQSRFISGFLTKSFEAGYDVCIFSMYRKYQDTTAHEAGESNIFSLMNPEKFDGAIILKDSIRGAEAGSASQIRPFRTDHRHREGKCAVSEHLHGLLLGGI